MTSVPFPVSSKHPRVSFGQFVALIASLMAVNALGIDSMLPALPSIGASLNVPTENEVQLIVTTYLLGLGIGQIAYGTLSDRFGRKPVILIGLGGYIVFSLLCGLSSSFDLMLAARLGQGLFGAATRVLTISIVRDCYSGRQMARVMSMSFLVFLAVPILAPSVGQIIMLVAPWRGIFLGLALFAGAVMTWMALRMPETLHPEDRTPISVKGVYEAFRLCLTNRMAIGYTLAMMMMLGGLFGFINSAQEVFVDVFDAKRWFTTVFGMIAFFVGVAALVNAKIVGRLGTRRVSHAALMLFVLVTTVHAIVAIEGYETIVTFAVLQASTMFCFGLVASNFGAMAMEPLGHIAGTGSSVQGFITTVGGSMLGFYVGQHFNGTVVPLTLGFSIFGVVALIVVFVTEKGRLFHPQHADPVAVPAE
jgi:DHA1 family bicyclomycin/chloramphenicol resistance-like MFS transporter